MVANTEVAILDRVIKPRENGLAPEAARYILSMKFDAWDHGRMDELATKARDGTLSPADAEELDEYRRVSDLLALFHSKARISLKHAGESS